MSDVLQNAHSSTTTIQNGSVITGVQKTGVFEKIAPEINNFVPSGTMFARWGDRFDEHYMGDLADLSS